MPPLPPAQLVLSALQHNVLPAAGGAALVMCLLLPLGRRVAAPASAAAVVFAFLWANHTFESPGWEESTARLVPWKPVPFEDGRPAPAWHWLVRAGLVLVVVGLLSRWLGLAAARSLPERRWWGANLLVWAPRAAAVGLVSGWLVGAAEAAEWPWLRPALIGVMLASWAALDNVARAGAGAQVAAYQGAMFLAAGAVLIHAGFGKFMDAATILGFAMFGIAAAVTAVTAYESPPQLLPWEEPPLPWGVSGAIPAGVALLPGLMLHGRLQTESQVPVTSFWLVALAPLALLPFLIPALAARNDWPTRVARALLVLAPLVAAVVLAAQHEKLTYPEL